MSSLERISFLQEKLQDIRNHYLSLKSEVASIDRRRKRIKKKERESESFHNLKIKCTMYCNSGLRTTTDLFEFISVCLVAVDVQCLLKVFIPLDLIPHFTA
jgi:hypothetical protein